MSEVNIVSAAIASGQSLSPEVDIGGWTLVGIVVPAAWTTAGISFQASADGGATFGELQTIAAVAFAISSITGGTQVYIAIDPTTLRGVRSLKVRSGTAAAPVSQGSSVTLSLVTRYVP